MSNNTENMTPVLREGQTERWFRGNEPWSGPEHVGDADSFIDAAMEFRRFFDYRVIPDAWIEDGFMAVIENFDKALMNAASPDVLARQYSKRPNTYVHMSILQGDE